MATTAIARVVASECLYLGSCTACQILFLFTTSVMLVFKFLAVLHHDNKVVPGLLLPTYIFLTFMFL